MKMQRRDVLFGLLGCAACGSVACAGGSSSSANDGGINHANSGDCTLGSADAGRPYCLVSALRVRVPHGAALKVGDAQLVNADDNTAVILARDSAGLFARSAICTHACCIVALCKDASCSALTPSPTVCRSTTVVRPSPEQSAVCPCHGSTFRLSDGSVQSGPARRPLPAYAVSVEGDDAWVDTGLLVDATART